VTEDNGGVVHPGSYLLVSSYATKIPLLVAQCNQFS
jgi:hypothetical protein